MKTVSYGRKEQLEAPKPNFTALRFVNVYFLVSLVFPGSIDMGTITILFLFLIDLSNNASLYLCRILNSDPDILNSLISLLRP